MELVPIKKQTPPDPNAKPIPPVNDNPAPPPFPRISLIETIYFQGERLPGVLSFDSRKTILTDYKGDDATPITLRGVVSRGIPQRLYIAPNIMPLISRSLVMVSIINTVGESPSPRILTQEERQTMAAQVLVARLSPQSAPMILPPKGSVRVIVANAHEIELYTMREDAVVEYRATLFPIGPAQAEFRTGANDGR